MPLIAELKDHDASNDVFLGIDFGSDSMWSLQPIFDGGGVPDTAKYTILAGNKSKLEADMIEYRPSISTDVDIVDGVDSESFRYKFWGIKYTAGWSTTGTLNFWLERKLDK